MSCLCFLRDHFGEVEANVERGKKENRSDPHFTSTMAQYLDVRVRSP